MIDHRWDEIEEKLFQYYQGEIDKIDQSHAYFLKEIDFLGEDGNITDIGRDYLDSKYIFERDEHVPLLRTEVLNLLSIRELCQSFYGQKTNRENVERYFMSKTEIEDSKEVGRILGLLNYLDVVSYSTRDGTVQFKQTDQVEKEDRESYRTTRRTPYSNLARFRKVLRSCEGDLFWIDGYFTKKGLEPLSEEITGDRFSSVRILSGPEHIETHVRDDFELFQKEMEYRDIEAELRVLTDSEKLRDLHDRWILSSDGASWNVPPINSIYGNQEAEMHQTEEDISFEDWWEEAYDIMDDWNDIQKFI